MMQALLVIMYSLYLPDFGRRCDHCKNIHSTRTVSHVLQSPLRALPDYITQYYQAVVSLERLEKYFNMDEKDGICVELLKTESGLSDLETEQRHLEAVMVGEITFHNCFYQWKQDSSTVGKEKEVETPLLATLDHVDNSENKLLKLNILNLKIRPASLVVMKGPVGSGKSSFCHALLGEMPSCNGRNDEEIQSQLQLRGRIAFAGQQAWIQSGRLRDNILFGLPYEKEKYDRVVDACCLHQDFVELPDGDMTFIGKLHCATVP